MKIYAEDVISKAKKYAESKSTDPLTKLSMENGYMRGYLDAYEDLNEKPIAL